jgi:hypothetical protein
LSGAAVLWAAALYQREAMMDKDQEEALLIAVAAVRRRARDIMELCKKDDMSWATGDLVQAKCQEIPALTDPIIFSEMPTNAG